MKKLLTKILLVAVCLLVGVNSAWADTYTNEAATITWAFTSHEDLTSTNVPADAFLSTNFSKGTNLQDPTTFNTKNCKAGWAEQTLVYFKPVTEVAKNAADAAENMLEWTITPATGITFTPENVSVTACTAGGTGDPQLTIYAVYSDNTTETVQSRTNPRRPDKTDQGDGPSVYTKTLENAKNGTFKVRIYLAGLTNTAKGMALTNIVVTGKVSGTPVATTTYTITAATNNASLGAATGTATVAENETVTLTATPTAAGSFTKWQKDGVDFDGNTANPLTVTATADATYTAIFEAKKAITFDKGEGTGTAPATDYVLSGENYTIPEVFFLYKTGATLTGWNDGVNTYSPGSTISNVTADIALTAVFTDNTVALGDAAATVNWTFDRSAGAPSIACENGEMDYVQHTTIGSTRFDVVMHVNTVKNAVIDGKTGKLNNTNSENNGQVNAATQFTIPVINGSVITYNGTNQTAAASDVTFGGENGSVSGAVTTYTYTGAAGTLDIVDTRGGFYPSGISVTYPEPKTKYDAPIITIGDFNFENKGYVVTITKADGDNLMVSTDGSSYTAQTSPYVTYASTTTHYYAKVTGSSLDDSDVADENVTSTFDDSKSYVAWIYESNYENKPKNYNVANDEIYKALNAIYNVVLVDIKDYKSATDEQKAALNGNLDDADLVVISEAAAGGSKAVIGLKDIVGSVPMVNMKLFAYTYNSDASKNRWGWGTPNNAAKDVVSVTPVSKLYKVLEGVSFTDSDVALFDYPNEQNHIQYVDSWQAEPEGDVVIALSGEKPAIHVSNTLKYFGIGLSCDDFTKYNANAVTIVKNAAAMLITGEDLAAIIIPEPSDPEIQGDVVILTTTASMQGWRAFYDASSGYTLDENTKAYVATKVEAQGESDVVVLDVLGNAVPQGMAVLLKTTNSTQDGYSMTLTKASNVPTPDIINKLKRAGAATNTQVYRLGANDAGVGFFAYTKEAAKPDVVVLDVDSSSAGARSLTIAFADDETTGVGLIDNGKLTIDNEAGAWYSIQGVRHDGKPSRSGLYIFNGKKVVIK